MVHEENIQFRVYDICTSLHKHGYTYYSYKQEMAGLRDMFLKNPLIILMELFEGIML